MFTHHFLRELRSFLRPVHLLLCVHPGYHPARSLYCHLQISKQKQSRLINILVQPPSYLTKFECTLKTTLFVCLNHKDQKSPNKNCNNKTKKITLANYSVEKIVDLLSAYMPIPLAFSLLILLLVRF